VEGEERLGAALEPQAVAAPLQPSIGEDARALFAAQRRVSALVLFPVRHDKVASAGARPQRQPRATRATRHKAT
jgi:hypothetical protein